MRVWLLVLVALTGTAGADGKPVIDFTAQARELFRVAAGPYFVQDPNNERKDFIKLWADQPARELPFRFGYPDKAKHSQLLITQPKATSHAAQ